jgi:hypothetical protein
MNLLRDPYAHVHPLYWPILWCSLRAFVAWSSRMIEEGHGFAGLSIEITWYGVIRVRALDLSHTRADFNRHMMGERRKNGRDLLARATAKVGWLLGQAAAGEGFGKGDAAGGHRPARILALGSSALPETGANRPAGAASGPAAHPATGPPRLSALSPVSTVLL